MREIHRWPVNSPHKGLVTWKMFPFDYVIIFYFEELLHWHWGYIAPGSAACVSTARTWTCQSRRIQSRSWPTLAQAYCMTAPGHYTNQCTFIFKSNQIFFSNTSLTSRLSVFWSKHLTWYLLGVSWSWCEISNSYYKDYSPRIGDNSNSHFVYISFWAYRLPLMSTRFSLHSLETQPPIKALASRSKRSQMTRHLFPWS